MKRIFIVMFLLLTLQIGLMAKDKDSIQAFFEVYEGSKKLDTVLFFDLTIYKSKGTVKWRLNQMEFNQRGGKETALLMRSSMTDDKFETPLISKLIWIPGQTFECNYLDLTNTTPIMLKGKKNEKNEWVIYGSGAVQIDGKMKKIEFKSTSNFNVKYKRMSFY